MSAIRKTKIIITLGKASSSTESLVKLLNAGIDGVRITTRFLPSELRNQVLENLKEAENITGRLVCVILSLREGDIRIGNGKSEKILTLSTGDEIMIVPQRYEGENSNTIVCNNSALGSMVKEGDKLLVEFGKAILTVVRLEDYHFKSDPSTPKGEDQGIERYKRTKPKIQKTVKIVVCRAENDCVLDGQNPLNFMNASSADPSTCNNELEDIRQLDWARGKDIDIVIYKQVRDKEDLEDLWNFEIPKDAKRFVGIQTRETAENPENYLDESDGCSIGRGILGVETSHSKVTFLQKQLVKLSNIKGKPVFISTHVLESMVVNDKPTRAEVVDSYCAVTDGVDGIMLTGETAFGKYPELAVQTLDRICVEAEQHVNYKKQRDLVIEGIPGILSTPDGLCYFAAEAVEKIGASLIICLTRTGRTARSLSRFKPNCLIAAVTDFEKTFRFLRVVRGVYPILVNCREDRENETIALRLVKEHQLARDGDRVVFIGSSRDTIIEGATSSLKIITLSN
jgi:pyruvate kinase